MAIKTVLAFPEVGNFLDDDILYLLRGNGTDRDKKIRAATLSPPGTSFTFAAEGSPLTITGTLNGTITAISSKRIAFCDINGSELKTYEYNSGTWTLIGTPLPLSIGSVSIAALTTDRVAVIEDNNSTLKVFDFDGTGWNQVGNTYTYPTGMTSPIIAALSPTRLIKYDQNSTELAVLDFDGSDWTLPGFITVTGGTTQALAALTSDRFAFIQQDTHELQMYDVVGDVPTAVGTPITISSANNMTLTALTSNRVAYIDGTNDKLRAYEFNGSTFSEVGTELSVSFSTGGITAMSNSRFAMINGTALSLYKIIPNYPPSPAFL
jgi:hypothetical protein